MLISTIKGILDKAWQTARKRLEAGDKSAAAKILTKYRKYLDLSSEEIRRIIISGSTETAIGLKKMNQAALDMAEYRNKEEDIAMTETAQAILGRDWE